MLNFIVSQDTSTPLFEVKTTEKTVRSSEFDRTDPITADISNATVFIHWLGDDTVATDTGVMEYVPLSSSVIENTYPF